MANLKYLTPFAFLALVSLGGLLGGDWTYAAAAATLTCMPALDPLLGTHEQFGGPAAALMRWFPRTFIVAQLALTFWMGVVVSRPQTPLFDAIGLVLSTGLTTGVFGMMAAHDAIHSRNGYDRMLGRGLLATALYMHFSISHLKGHHRSAATDQDPASARFGEGLYRFIVRSVGGQLREAWRHEHKRLGGHERRTFGLQNRMVVYSATEVALLVALALLSWRALAFLLAVAAIAVGLLEAFNYVAHYGLRRRVGPDGLPEPLEVGHSWNSKTRIDGAALFNMGCHSDHHRRPKRYFEELDVPSGAAELPFGYGTALLAALIPTIWRYVMDKRVTAVMTDRPRGSQASYRRRRAPIHQSQAPDRSKVTGREGRDKAG